MNNLKQLQTQFLTDLMQQSDAELNYIKTTDKLTASQRLQIYRDSMIEGFIVTLIDTYPVCNKIVGDVFFRAMAKQYAVNTASLSPDLGDYGATFPQFITNFAPAQQLPYLADVAAFEWTYYQILHGGECVAADFSQLTNVAEEHYEFLYFQLVKPHFLYHSVYPLQRIWEIHQPEFTGEFSVDLTSAAYYFFIWKKQAEVKMLSLTQELWDFIQTINQQKYLASFSESQLALLADAVSLGWITDFIIRGHQ